VILQVNLLEPELVVRDKAIGKHSSLDSINNFNTLGKYISVK
jgi:hypothetical protein